MCVTWIGIKDVIPRVMTVYTNGFVRAVRQQHVALLVEST